MDFGQNCLEYAEPPRGTQTERVIAVKQLSQSCKADEEVLL